MHRLFLRFASLLFAGFLLTACVSPGGAGGLLFNNYTGPYQALGSGSGPRIGEASVQCFIGLVCIGDAGIATAAADGGISRISTVDYRYMSILAILYTKTTIIVTGN